MLWKLTAVATKISCVDGFCERKINLLELKFVIEVKFHNGKILKCFNTRLFTDEEETILINQKSVESH